MTGETSRVVDISQVATSKPGGGNFLPELTNNINLLSDMAEAELVTMENKRAQVEKVIILFEFNLCLITIDEPKVFTSNGDIH